VINILVINAIISAVDRKNAAMEAMDRQYRVMPRDGLLRYDDKNNIMG